MASDRLRRVTVLFDTRLGDGPELPREEPREPTVKAIAAAVAAAGARVEKLEVSDDLDALAAGLSKQRPDLVFNLCERFAHNPQLAPDVAAALELMQVHYTGAGPAALHIGNDPDLARRLLALHGIPVAGEDDEEGEAAFIAVVGNGEDREIFAVPPTGAAAAQALGELVEPIWQVLHLKDYALLAARVAGGEARLVRVVPNPPLEPFAAFAAAARRGGWTYERLIRRIVDEAWGRKQDERRQAESPLA